MRRTVVRGVVLAAVGAFAALATVRCADVNRGLGASCILDADCQSGLCSGSQCVAQPPLFDGGETVDAGEDAVPATEAGGDASTGHDSGPPMKDAMTPPKDTGVDGTMKADGGDASSKDGALDGPASDAHASDAAPEASHDAAASGDAQSGDASSKDGALSG